MNLSNYICVTILLMYSLVRTYGLRMQPELVPLTNSIMTKDPRNMQQQQQQQQQQPHPYSQSHSQTQNCPVLGTSLKAYRASVVVEAKIRSMSSNRRQNYSVTFQITNVFKDLSGFRPLLQNETIRLHFQASVATTAVDSSHGSGKSPISNSSTHNEPSSRAIRHRDKCPTRLNENLPFGHHRWRFKTGKLYLLFMHRTGSHEFKVSDEPVPKSKRTLNDVQSVLNDLKPVSLSGLRKVYRVQQRDRLRLVCRVQGLPPVPSIFWFKDGQELQNIRIRRIRIQKKRKRSILTISKTRFEDSGRYECQAKSSLGGPNSFLAAMVFIESQPPLPSQSHSKSKSKFDSNIETRPENSSPCPIPDNSYCLNGGTCLYFETVGEPACKCAEGFNGQRCENKDVTNKSSMYRPQSFSCKLGLSTSYYC